MFRLAPNIELLFSEAGTDAADRVRAAAAAGFDAVEMWFTSTKDVPELAKACIDLGVEPQLIVAEPYGNFTIPGIDLTPVLDGVSKAVEDACTLRCPRVVLTTGTGFPAVDRRANLELLLEGLHRCLDLVRGSGVRLIVEAVNTRVDHPGALLDRTADAAFLAEAIGEPEHFTVMYDLYHSLVNEEDPAVELARLGGYLDYVGVAGRPGRGAPGAEPDTVDWPAFFTLLRDSGYRGPVGLEVFAEPPTLAALTHIRFVNESLGA